MSTIYIYMFQGRPQVSYTNEPSNPIYIYIYYMLTLIGNPQMSYKQEISHIMDRNQHIKLFSSINNPNHGACSITQRGLIKKFEALLLTAGEDRIVIAHVTEQDLLQVQA